MVHDLSINVENLNQHIFTCKTNLRNKRYRWRMTIQNNWRSMDNTHHVFLWPIQSRNGEINIGPCDISGCPKVHHTQELADQLRKTTQAQVKLGTFKDEAIGINWALQNSQEIFFFKLNEIQEHHNDLERISDQLEV